MKKDKNLLVISNGFPNEDQSIPLNTFTKSQVDELKSYFKKIKVIVPIPYVPDLIGNLFQKASRINKLSRLNDYEYDNVEVHYIRFFTLPISLFRRHNGMLASFWVKKFLRQHEAFLDNTSFVHAFFAWPSGYVAGQIKKAYDLKEVITLFGFDLYKLPFKNDYWHSKIKSICQFANTTTTNARKHLIHARKLGINPKIIYQGYDGSKFQFLDSKEARKHLEIEKKSKILVTVGRLIPLKNHETLIRAVKKLRRTGIDCQCYIVGSGPLRKKLNELIKDLNLTDAVHLVGSQPHDKIAYWIAAGDVFVLPSLAEGNPTVLFEALATGTYYVGTDVGGVREIVSSERVGLLYKPPRSSEVLKSTLLKALKRTEDPKYLAEYAKEYSAANAAAKYVELYKSI